MTGTRCKELFMGQDIHVYLARKTSEYAQKNGCEKYYPVELYTKYDNDGAVSYEYADPYCGRNYELFSWLMDGNGRTYVDEADHPIGKYLEYDGLVPRKILKEWEDWEESGAYGYNVVTLADIIDHYNMIDSHKYAVNDMLGSHSSNNELKDSVGDFIEDIKRYCSIEGAYYLTPQDILVVYWFDS
jgi:hypothetical protein